ncbi:hypothetical protein KKH13_05235 [Patescibacteria group bacterium]|nr:hypothetical protein [Patescibacteria group bacterium]
MAIMKRATKQLRDAGIEHIEIHKGLYGYTPYDSRLTYQASITYNTADEAVRAVKGGTRPEEGRKRRSDEYPKTADFDLRELPPAEAAHSEPERRRCNDCGEEWTDWGDAICIFCQAVNTELIEND